MVYELLNVELGTEFTNMKILTHAQSETLYTTCGCLMKGLSFWHLIALVGLGKIGKNSLCCVC